MTIDGGAAADSIAMRQMASVFGIDRDRPTWRQEIMHVALPDLGQDDEDARLVEEALRCADTGSAGHWPTAASFLAAEVRRLRRVMAEDSR